jgi:hemolysin type calcium-binding protein
MNRTKRARGQLGLILGSMLVLGIEATPVMPQTIGMVADNATHSVTVFNADTDTVLGTVELPGSDGAIGDCSITSDQTRGFVTDFGSQVWAIDLTTSPPSLAPDPNPIAIVNFGEDTALSPDQRFLVVCDGSAVQPISVVDRTTQTEVSTFDLGSDCNSVDVCRDGSVLVTSNITGKVRRLTLDSAGQLTDTGEELFSGGTGARGPMNVYCAPGGTSGFQVRFLPAQIQSFTVPGLNLVNVRALSGRTGGVSAAVNPMGNRVFARGNGGAVDVFNYNASTGTLSATPLFSLPIADTRPFFGMEQLALHPKGTKLYVSQPNALNVYNANTGAALTSIIAPNIVEPTGVCFRRTVIDRGARQFSCAALVADECGAPTLTGTAGDDTLEGTNGRDIIVGLGGNDVVKGKGKADCTGTETGNDTVGGNKGDDLICDAGGKNTLKGGEGNDTLVGSVQSDGTNTIKGEDGDDVLFTYGGTNRIEGGEGNDFIASSLSDAGDDTISGGEGDDVIVDFGGTNRISGDDGNDLIESQGGSSTIRGGSGDDCIVNAAGTTDGGEGFDVCCGGAATANCEATSGCALCP